MVQRFSDITIMFAGLWLVCEVSGLSFLYMHLLVALITLVVFQMLGKAQELAEATRLFFAGENLDALLLPAAYMTAPRLDAPAETYGKARLLMNLFSITGNPVLVYPGGRIDGMPFGMQLVGPVRTDALLIELAARFERQYRPFSLAPAAPERRR